MKTKFIPFIAFSLLIIVSCKQAKNDQSIAETSDNTNSGKAELHSIADLVPEQYETVDAKNGGTVVFQSGSKVTFPNNCFETLDGAEVKGKVLVEWNEYHTLSEIMCSDISMMHDGGVLSSGGMFEISGTDENHNEVRIKDGKSYEVEVLNDRTDKKFPFLEYDKDAKKWTELAKDTENKSKVKKESISEKAQKNGHIFSIPVSTKNYPELNSQQIIGWYTAEEQEFVVRTKDYSSFKGKIEMKNPDGTYKLIIKYGSEQRSYDAQPVTIENQNNFVREEDLARSDIFEKYMTDYRDGKAHRIVRLESFGTYNWDILHQFPNNTPLFCRFEHSDKFLELSKAFFVIPGNEISVPLKIKGDQFHMIENTSCGIVMIYPDKTVGIMNSQEIMTNLKDQKSAKTLIFGESNIYSFEDVKDLDVLIKKHI